ncbi:MAG: Hpt domain-containing protein [Saprospiraceae bacterium]|nr:Hpt domain-containing protein [Saprospiraceae bacterium]
MPNQSERLYKLDKLIEFIGDDKDAILNMVGIFLKSTSGLLSQIQTGLLNKDFVTIGKTAHMLNPTLDIFGIDTLHDVIREIEKIAKNADNVEGLPKLIDQLSTTMKEVFLQVENDFPNP